MIGRAPGLWNLVIYSKAVKTIADTVLVQSVCHFASVTTIFLSHEPGRVMSAARLTLAESWSLMVWVLGGWPQRRGLVLGKFSLLVPLGLAS